MPGEIKENNNKKKHFVKGFGNLHHIKGLGRKIPIPALFSQEFLCVLSQNCDDQSWIFPFAGWVRVRMGFVTSVLPALTLYF